MSSNILKILLIAILIGGIVFAYISYKKNDKQKFSDQDFKELMNGLMSQDDELRFGAIDKVQQFKPNKLQALYMIQSAKNQYPKAEYEWQNISAILIDSATANPNEDYISEIKKVFSELNPQAKSSSLRFLQIYGNKEAIEAYMELLAKHYREIENLPLVDLERNPKYEEIIFPRILHCVDEERIANEIYLLTLKYLENGLISINHDNKFTDQVLAECQKNREHIALMQGPKDKSDWIWDNENYLELRYKQGILLDLLGFINSEASIDELRRGLGYNDNRLKYFSIISLLKQEKEITMDDIESVAADSESRNWLYDGLKKINRLDLFPKQNNNQAAFAESDMVNWLTYPTELGRVPDEIELMEVVAEDTKTADGVIEFYLFRFKSNHPDWIENGWMAGLSGPFLTKDGANTDVYGYTFSAFEKWEDKSIDEHVTEIREIIDAWKAKKK